jgi:hypothetical protein
VFSGYLVTSSIISELERGDFSVIRRSALWDAPLHTLALRWRR